MKILHNSSVHKVGRSHDFFVIKIKESVFFLTYEAYNAVEKFAVEIFNGNEKCYLLSIYDLGDRPNSSAYSSSDSERQLRSKDLFNKAVKILEKFI